MLRFFDTNCMIGRRMSCREGSLVTTADVVEIMERCGIDRALVYHSVAKENDMKLGNSLLKEDIADYPQFMQQWAVMPSTFGDFMKPDELLEKMKVADVRSVRLVPATFKYSLKPNASGELINALAEHNVPIFIEFSQTNADALYNLCTDYPKARFILCEPGYVSARYLFPVMKSCSNLYMETSNLVTHNGVERFCSEFGAERLIFGTGIPNVSAAGAVSLIRYANISEADKEKIAYKNIESLLGEVSL